MVATREVGRRLLILIPAGEMSFLVDGLATTLTAKEVRQLVATLPTTQPTTQVTVRCAGK